MRFPCHPAQKKSTALGKKAPLCPEVSPPVTLSSAIAPWAALCGGVVEHERGWHLYPELLGEVRRDLDARGRALSPRKASHSRCRRIMLW